ncbi:hypothetical protein FHG87_013678 [Trinorchestia longiramus]|nr:hypothetical protein FHG87_013678 [Trinorchestia longiramus]
MLLKNIRKKNDIYSAIKETTDSWAEVKQTNMKEVWKKLCPQIFLNNVDVFNVSIDDAKQDVIGLTKELKLNVSEDDIENLMECSSEEDDGVLNSSTETDSDSDHDFDTERTPVKLFTATKFDGVFSLISDAMRLLELQDSNSERFSSVGTIIHKWKCWNTTFSNPRTGRPRKINDLAARKLVRTVVQRPQTTREALKADLKASGIEASKHNQQGTMSWRSSLPHHLDRTPLLQKRHVKARLKYANDHLNKPEAFWNSVLWGPPTTKNVCSNCNITAKHKTRKGKTQIMAPAAPPSQDFNTCSRPAAKSPASSAIPQLSKLALQLDETHNTMQAHKFLMKAIGTESRKQNKISSTDSGKLDLLVHMINYSIMQPGVSSLKLLLTHYKNLFILTVKGMMEYGRQWFSPQ